MRIDQTVQKKKKIVAVAMSTESFENYSEVLPSCDSKARVLRFKGSRPKEGHGGVWLPKSDNFVSPAGFSKKKVISPHARVRDWKKGNQKGS